MWYIIILLLTITYLLINILLPQFHQLNLYLVTPFLWFIITLVVLLLAHHQNLNILRYKKIRKWTLGGSPIQAGLLIGGFQVALLIIIGIFTSFGKSPFSFTSTNLLLNILYVTMFLLGTELSRAYLIKIGSQKKHYTTTIIIFITFLFVLLRIQPSDLSLLSSSNPAQLLEFLGSTILPAIAINLLASYLAYLGGATASISYMGVLLIFEWFSPILPTPQWTLLALIGTIAPTIGYTLLQTAEKYQHKKRNRHHPTSSEYSWTAVSIFSVLIVFFSFGYLGVTPTVISSGSMQPTLHVGDIVLIQKTSPDTLKQGDIIQFKHNNITLVHRIYAISTDETQYTHIITKGDANPQPDPEQINPNQILGKSLLTIPFLGWIPIHVKNIMQTLRTTIS
jgi:signal peptidase